MEDRQLRSILSSGEISSIYLGGLLATDKVIKALDLIPYNLRIEALEEPEQPQYMPVVNLTGSIIPKGKAIRHDGVDPLTNLPKAALALADTFTNATILGVTSASIGIGETGYLTTFGKLTGLDTSLLSIGVPTYLSDTSAGDFTQTPPDITTQIGGVLLSDAAGELFVSINNTIALPTVVGFMGGLTTPAKSLTATPQNLTNYTDEKSVIIDTDLTSGIITIPTSGVYRAQFATNLVFVSATITRVVTFEIYNITQATVVHPYAKNIPRDATESGVNFSIPFEALAGDQIIMRAKSVPDMSATLNNTIFDIESTHIK